MLLPALCIQGQSGFPNCICIYPMLTALSFYPRLLWQVNLQTVLFSRDLWCGFSREKVFLAKTITYFVAILPVMLIHVLTGMVIRTIMFGFGMNLNTDTLSYIVKMSGYCIIGVTGFGGFAFYGQCLAGVE